MSGRAMVFLHGQPGSTADWRLLACELPRDLRLVALDRPGYGASREAAGGFSHNAQAVVAHMDAHAIERAVLVGHSYGGGVALMAARLAPERVGALILIASVGPGCLNAWDRLLAAPVVGEVCALVAWRLTPWLPRAALALLARLRGRPVADDEHVGWQVWGGSYRGPKPAWRSFLTEQRALVTELNGLAASLPQVRLPVLIIADPDDPLIPIEATRQLAEALPDSRVEFLPGAGHHLPRRAAPRLAAAAVQFLADLENRPMAT